MGKAYYFVKRSGNNQCGSEYMRWVFSTEYTSKTALKKAYTTGRRSVRMADIYRRSSFFRSSASSRPSTSSKRFCSINRSFAPERKRKHGRQEDRC